MFFNSYVFIFFFFPVFLLSWIALFRTRNSRWTLLLLSSCLFYAWWDFRFLALLAYIIVINFTAGNYIYGLENQKTKKQVLIISIILSLLPLVVFKYLPWLGGYASVLLESESRVAYDSLLSSIILPLGISFFTFQALTYTIGLYNNKCSHCASIVKFSVYVSMFPQLMSGPIVRYQDLDDQLENIGDLRNKIDLKGGVELFFIGLIKKIIIADRIGMYINPIFQPGADLSATVAWLAVMGYSLQLYFDFSGYSDMAIGIGRCMGIKLPDNFRAPYTASNPSDFWRRWHISLSTWLRDYLFIPLGGSWKGNVITYRNLIITMFLAGVWHGANWTFICWGIWHGLMLCVYRATPAHIKKRMPVWFSVLLLNIAVLIGWTFFRTTSVEHAFEFFNAMLGFRYSAGAAIAWPIYFMIPLGYMIHYFERRISDKPVKLGWSYAVLLAGASAWAILELGKDAPFIYFQF
ncbi:MAG: MBOAT family protein [Nitrospira sp.]|nr:MBOAT family protein [Nitrospira sp.]